MRAGPSWADVSRETLQPRREVAVADPARQVEWGASWVRPDESSGRLTHRRNREQPVVGKSWSDRVDICWPLQGGAGGPNGGAVGFPLSGTLVSGPQCSHSYPWMGVNMVQRLAHRVDEGWNGGLSWVKMVATWADCVDQVWTFWASCEGRSAGGGWLALTDWAWAGRAVGRRALRYGRTMAV